MSLEYMHTDELRALAVAHSDNCSADSKAATLAKSKGELRIADSFTACAMSELDLALLYARELKRRQTQRNARTN